MRGNVMKRLFGVMWLLLLSTMALAQGSVDPQTVGFWEYHDNSGNTFHWVIGADGTYSFSEVLANGTRPPVEQGRIQMAGGKYLMTSSQGQSHRSLYRILSGGMQTSAAGQNWVGWFHA